MAAPDRSLAPIPPGSHGLSQGRRAPGRFCREIFGGEMTGTILEGEALLELSEDELHHVLGALCFYDQALSRYAGLAEPPIYPDPGESPLYPDLGYLDPK